MILKIRIWFKFRFVELLQIDNCMSNLDKKLKLKKKNYLLFLFLLKNIGNLDFEIQIHPS